MNFWLRLGQDGVEVERHLLGSSGSWPGSAFCSVDLVLELVGDFLKLVRRAGKEQARLDAGKIDLGQDGGDLRRERLQIGADVVRGLPVLHRVGATGSGRCKR